MVTVSQDCLVNLWKIKNIAKAGQQFFEPYITLRGHTAPVYAITGPKLNAESEPEVSESLSKLLYTAGKDGVIRVWNMPGFLGDEKYPQTDGRNFQVGTLSDADGNEPYWRLEYHAILPLLLSIKGDSKIQVWDCKELSAKALTYDIDNEEQCRLDFVQETVPLKEMSFRLEGKEPAACSIAWLPTDNNQFVVGYEDGHVVLFNYKTGTVQQAVMVHPSPIVSVVAHFYQPVVVCGHLDGQISWYDFKAQKKVYSADCKSPVQTLALMNNCLNVVAGLSCGSIKLFDMKGQVQTVVEKAHLPKGNCGVNQLIQLQASEKANASLPLLISCGGDSMVKVFEHNLYKS